MAFQSSMTNFGCQMQICHSILIVQPASSGKAFGAYFQGKWAYGLWPEEWCQLGITKYITELELFKFFMAIEIYITELELFKIFVAIEI